MAGRDRSIGEAPATLGTWRREALQRRETVSLQSSEAAGALVLVLS